MENDSTKNNPNSSDYEETTSLLAMQLACGSVLPMVLKSAIELNLLELIKKADPGSASASELASQLQTKNPEAPHAIDRILRLLAAYDVLICSVRHVSDADFERRYSLGSVCKYLTKNEDGVSLGPWSISLQGKVFMESWYHLKDAILEGGVPFDRAHGMNAFEYPATDEIFNTAFNRAMSQHSTMFIKKLLEIYKGFEGLSSLVDVGGGIGTTIDMIVSKYPTIKGINFDLPHVVKHAPPYPGVEHVGGDMFDSVPKADAIFMKWICHDWSDAHCQKLLKNCYESLPDKNGKVIIADSILPQKPEKGLAYKRSVLLDVMMLAFNPGGKERSEHEFEALAKQAGFKGIQKICCALNFWIIELYK